MSETIVSKDKQELYTRLSRGMTQLAGELTAIQDALSPDQGTLPFDGSEYKLELLVVPPVAKIEWKPKFEDISQLYRDYVCFIRGVDHQEGDELRLFEGLVPVIVDNFAWHHQRDFTHDELQLLDDQFKAFMSDPTHQGFREQIAKEIKESE